jgi:cytochrome c peroxidase
MVLERLTASAAYRALFARVFPAVGRGSAIDFSMVARAIAEFEFTLVFANAPIDRSARGETQALSVPEKRGATLFFGKAGCVSCHAVAGRSNEMFSDFQMHVAGVPQIAPQFGIGTGNVIFDGLSEDEDFGLEQVTMDAGDRYKFAARRFATCRCSRPSFTMALSRGSRTPSRIISTSSDRRVLTRPFAQVLTRT